MSGPIRAGSQGPLIHRPTGSRAALAGLLAVVVHLIALVALTYGFHMQHTRQEPMSAELWAALPPPPVTAVQKPAPAKPAPQPEPAPKPKPAPPPVPKPPAPPPPPKERPVKAPPKVDIELKAKEARAAKQAEDEKRKLEEARKRDSEKLKAEAKAQAIREAEAKAQAAREAEALAEKQALANKEAQAKLAEADRVRKEQEDQARRAAEAAASAQSKLMAAYVDKIASKVRRFIVEPPGVPRTATAIFEVVLIPGGDVLSVRLLKSSGNAPYDEAVERAIRRAEPLPIPPEPQMFPQFRTLTLKITPKE